MSKTHFLAFPSLKVSGRSVVVGRSAKARDRIDSGFKTYPSLKPSPASSKTVPRTLAEAPMPMEPLRHMLANGVAARN